MSEWVGGRVNEGMSERVGGWTEKEQLPLPPPPPPPTTTTTTTRPPSQPPETPAPPLGPRPRPSQPHLSFVTRNCAATSRHQLRCVNSQLRQRREGPEAGRDAARQNVVLKEAVCIGSSSSFEESR